jgi:hypothetical protein
MRPLHIQNKMEIKEECFQLFLVTTVIRFKIKLYEKLFIHLYKSFTKGSYKSFVIE